MSIKNASKRKFITSRRRGNNDRSSSSNRTSERRDSSISLIDEEHEWSFSKIRSRKMRLKYSYDDKIIINYLHSNIGRKWSDVSSELIKRTNQSGESKFILNEIIGYVESTINGYSRLGINVKDFNSHYRYRFLSHKLYYFYISDNGILEFSTSEVGKYNIIDISSLIEIESWLSNRLIIKFNDKFHWNVMNDYDLSLKLDYNTESYNNYIGKTETASVKPIFIDIDSKLKTERTPSFSIRGELFDVDLKYLKSIPEEIRKVIIL